MLEEQYLIPYHNAELPDGNHWMVFAPHADDESFGMGGTILLASQKHIKITLVIMTNGQLGIDEQEKAAAAQIRKKEAQAAADFLGIQGIIFLDENDRSLKNDEPTQNKIIDLLKSHKPDTVFIPSPYEFHPDHRVTTQLVWDSLINYGFKESVYCYEISAQGPVNTLIDISSVASKKLAVMQSYNSQIEQNNYIDIVQALDKARTYTLDQSVDYAEGFFKLSLTQATPPHIQAQLYLHQYNISGEADLLQQITSLKQANEQILKSTSWQITRPLRRIKLYLSNIFK